MKPWTAAVTVALGLIVGAGIWWVASAPDETERRTAEVLCSMRGKICDLPSRATTGPIILAIAGAVLLLIGVQLRGQNQT